MAQVRAITLTGKHSLADSDSSVGGFWAAARLASPSTEKTLGRPTAPVRSCDHVEREATLLVFRRCRLVSTRTILLLGDRAAAAKNHRWCLARLSGLQPRWSRGVLTTNVGR